MIQTHNMDIATRRPELIKAFVLDVISDDYENLEMIVGEVTKYGRRCGMAISAPEIISALVELRANDLVRAYKLEATAEPPQEIHGQLGALDLEKLYFFPSGTGRKLQLEDFPDWPFDSVGAVREGWTPPE